MQSKVIIYNPKRGGEIKDFRWEGGAWKLGVNKMSKFPPTVAQELLKRYGFLVKVKAEDVGKFLKEMTAKMISCPHCEEYEAETEAKLQGHILGKHKVTKESKKILDNIPEAEVVLSKKVRKEAKKELSIEEQEGIVGEGWTGGGLEDDAVSSDMTMKRPGDPGNFN